MFFKNWSYWLKGGLIGFIAGIIFVIPGLLMIFIVSPEALNFILSYAIQLIPRAMYDSTNALSGVAVANLVFIFLFVATGTLAGALTGVIMAKIKRNS
jgi:predicted branched-subunit amino acid permease